MKDDKKIKVSVKKINIGLVTIAVLNVSEPDITETNKFEYEAKLEEYAKKDIFEPSSGTNLYISRSHHTNKASIAVIQGLNEMDEDIIELTL